MGIFGSQKIKKKFFLIKFAINFSSQTINKSTKNFLILKNTQNPKFLTWVDLYTKISLVYKSILLIFYRYILLIFNIQVFWGLKSDLYTHNKYILLLILVFDYLFKACISLYVLLFRPIRKSGR